MSIVMGLMLIVMAAGFWGYGHHQKMAGGQGGETVKEASAAHEHCGEAPCPDMPNESRK